MDKDEILEKSRSENKNQDLAEISVVTQANSIAARVGAALCCLVSVLLMRMRHFFPCGPWIIYFGILGTSYLVRFIKIKRPLPHLHLFPDAAHGTYVFCNQIAGCCGMNEELKLKNRLKEARAEKGLSQAQLAQLVGVSRNTISSIETGQFNPTAKLALILCVALDRKFEDLFYF